LSLRSKARIRAHRHLSYEVTEAEEEIFKPRPKGVHARDVLVNHLATLDETIVEWTRCWEEEEFRNVNPNVSVVSDAEANNDKALKVPSAAGNILEVFDTPDFRGQIAGDFYILFRIKVASNVSSAYLGKLRLVANATTRSYYEIYPNELPNNKYHIIALRGRVDKNDSDAYGDLYDFRGGITDLYIDYVGILPANTPLGYADVTVITEDPGSYGKKVDPGSVGDSEDPGTDAAIEDPASAGDEVDPGTYSLGNAFTNVSILSTLYSATKTINDTAWTTLQSGTCSVVSDPAPLSLIIVRVNVIDGWARVCIKIQIDATDLDVETKIVFLTTAMGGDFHFFFWYQGSLSGATIKAVARADTGQWVNVSTAIDVYQYKKHDHTITGDAHTTPIIGDSHDHLISGDAHGHTISGDQHETPILGDSHSHLDEERGHKH